MEPHIAAESSSLSELLPSRREPAEHPGPAIARNYLAPIGFTAAALAVQIGIEPQRLKRMLEGIDSIDIESAIRLGRALQINPRIIAERQARHDFARLREDVEVESVSVLRNEGHFAFPEAGYMRGRLAGLRENSMYGGVRDETLGFFPDESGANFPHTHAYSIEVGAKLRVYDDAGEPIYVGIVMRTFEGRPLLPFARPNEWIGWFTERRRADYISPEPN